MELILNQKKVEGYGYMSPRQDAEKYKPSSSIRQSALPSKVDLREHMTPVEDQKTLSSCTANAVAGAYEYLIKKYLSKKAFDVSRLFIYYNARLRANNVIKDSGSHIQYAVDSLMKMGACKESVWPYELKKVNEKPHEKSYLDASNFKIEKTKFVPVKLEDWKKCLAEGYPIVFGIALFPSFDSCNKNHGVVPMPSPDEASRSAHGLHAMLCVGYSEPDQMFIVRNSWGENWGDKGYCYMPYNYVINNKFNLGDCWIFGRSTPIPDFDDTWIDDKRSIINDGKGYNKNQFVVYNEKDYKNFDVWETIEVIEYDEEITEEYEELEYESEGEYDEILEEYESQFGEEEEYEEESDEESEDEEEYEEEEADEESEYEEEYDEEESDEESEDEEEYEEESDEESEDEEEYDEEEADEESEDEEEYDEEESDEESEDEEEYEEESDEESEDEEEYEEESDEESEDEEEYDEEESDEGSEDEEEYEEEESDEEEGGEEENSDEGEEEE